MARSPGRGPSWLDSVQDSPSLCLQSLPSRVSRLSCLWFLLKSFYEPNANCRSRIDDRKSAKPRMRGFLHGSKVIFQERGIRGFFQGFVPTTARQAANSATRFTTYTTLKQFAEGYVAPGEKLGTLSTFAIGGIAGIITVYVLLRGPNGEGSFDH